MLSGVTLHRKELVIRSVSQLVVKTSSARRVEAARDAIVRAFATGHPPIERIAGAVNMSVRTFQRRLAEAGRTYKMLLDEVRFVEARRALASSNESLKAISFELGFAEQASFTRAFRRWTGLAPSEYRRRQRLPKIQPRSPLTAELPS